MHVDFAQLKFASGDDQWDVCVPVESHHHVLLYRAKDKKLSWRSCSSSSHSTDQTSSPGALARGNSSGSLPRSPSAGAYSGPSFTTTTTGEDVVPEWLSSPLLLAHRWAHVFLLEGSPLWLCFVSTEGHVAVVDVHAGQVRGHAQPLPQAKLCRLALPMPLERSVCFYSPLQMSLWMGRLTSDGSFVCDFHLTEVSDRYTHIVALGHPRLALLCYRILDGIAESYVYDQSANAWHLGDLKVAMGRHTHLLPLRGGRSLLCHDASYSHRGTCEIVDLVYDAEHRSIDRVASSVQQRARLPCNRLLFLTRQFVRAAHIEPLMQFVQQDGDEDGLVVVGYMRRRVHVAAVGCGDHLSKLAHVMRELHDHDVHIAGACDSSPEAMQRAVWSSVPRFPTMDLMLNLLPQIDWVMIGSMNSEHLKDCLQAFQRQKNVYCEKPLALSYDECHKLLDAYKPLSSALQFATGFVLRASVFYTTLKDQVAKIGRIVSIQANELLSPSHGGYIMRNWRRHRNKGGPFMLEKCCHDIDIVNWLLESVPARVAHFGGTSIFTPQNQPIIQESAHHSDPSTFTQQEYHETYLSNSSAWENVDPFVVEKDSEDVGVVILEYENGARVSFHSNACVGLPQRRITICGTLGTVDGELLSGRIVVQTMKGYAHSAPSTVIQCPQRGGHGGGDAHMMDDLYRCMIYGEEPLVPATKDGMRAVLTCLALDEAMQNKTVVELAPVWKSFNDVL